MSIKKHTGLFLVLALAAGLALFGNMACSGKKAGTEGAAPAGGEVVAPVSQEMSIKEGVNDIAGTVKSALGKYFYISQMPGFDLAAVGQFDAATLVDKEVKVKAEFHRDRPSLLLAQSIEVKQDGGAFANVFTAASPASPEDFFDQKARAEFAEIKIANIMKAADWEGKGKVKLYGKYLPAADKSAAAISVLDDKGKETAKVLVDTMSEYSNFYLKKLRLFDKFYFYLTVKESVAANLRGKAKEVFHADVVFAGLY
ncbi:MAG: hypothetical protein NTZ26_00515 [Candidatus Aminicenantes bacterium]|nr:hypothetical protein [Candidatus Aminicenantes bacterium]